MENTIQKILENFTKTTGLRTHWRENNRNNLDGTIDFYFDNGREQVIVEVKRELRNHHLAGLFKMKKLHDNVLVIAENIFPNLKNELRRHHIGYIDAAGNAFLKTKKHFFLIEGKKDQITNTDGRNKVFTKAGIKLIFHFLLDPDLINATYREIAERTNAGLDTIHKVIHGLKEQAFILALNNKQVKIKNTRQLLERWMVAYEEKLKPDLLIDRFRFLRDEERMNWKKFPLKEGTVWGGEPGGGMMTNYLKPAEFTIYTNEFRADLIRNYKFVPDPNGNVKAYQKFWTFQETKFPKCAPALIVYADLMNTADPRCIETAQKIYDKELHFIGQETA